VKKAAVVKRVAVSKNNLIPRLDSIKKDKDSNKGGKNIRLATKIECCKVVPSESLLTNFPATLDPKDAVSINCIAT